MDDRTFPTRPLVGIAAVVFRDSSVLLIRRARPPLAGALSFPGGAQELGETAEAAARRELLEETGLAAGALRLSSHADVLDRDADGRMRFHLHFTGLAAAGTPIAAGDVSEAIFVPVADLAGAGLDAAHRLAVARAWTVLHTD